MKDLKVSKEEINKYVDYIINKDPITKIVFERLSKL